MTTPQMGGANGLGEVAAAAHDQGRRLGLMLDAANFTDEQKAAWAALLPSLSLAEIDRLEELLQKNLSEQVAQEFEDVILKMKAAQTKRDLSADALAMKTDQELAALAEELTALEAR